MISAQTREINKTKGTKYIMYIQNNILILKKNKKHQGNKNQGGEWITEGSTSPSHSTYNVVVFDWPIG